MFSTEETKIINRMRQLSQEFADTGEFAPKLIQQAAEVEGVKPLWSIRDKSTQIRRGVYHMDQSNFGSDIPAPKAAATKPAAAVELSPVQEAVAKQFKQARVSHKLEGAVPPVDPNYVPFGNYRDLERIIKSKQFFPVLITGHSGNGKSSQIMQIHAKNNLPIIRVNLTKNTDEDVLIGTKTLVDGNIMVVEGPILTAMRQGCTVLLDEIDASAPNTIMCLQTILEGRAYYFPATGEYVNPAPGFNVIMTANTKGQGSADGRYIGTQILNEAFLERIAFTFEQEYPSAAIEKRILLNIMQSLGCVDDQFANDLVKWAGAIRRSFFDGALDSLIATRRLEHIIRGYAMFKDKKFAVEKAVSRFDEMTKQAFIALFDKISADDVVIEAAEQGE